MTLKIITFAHVAFVLSILFCDIRVSAQVFFKSGSPRVTFANGGVISGGLSSSRDGRPFTLFTGIQYATVRERFAESQLITETWEGVKEKVKPGPMCPQNPFGGEGDSFGEEECLNLNVYVPMNNTGKKGYPILIWVHGGGFSFGGGYGYGPKFFMDE